MMIVLYEFDLLYPCRLRGRRDSGLGPQTYEVINLQLESLDHQFTGSHTYVFVSHDLDDPIARPAR